MPPLGHERGVYRLAINGRWSIVDLYTLPHAYNQVYSFLYTSQAQVPIPIEQVRHPYEAYPWEGGFSAVNFYSSLIKRLPLEARPEIRSIQYASPGWIELGLISGIAYWISELVPKFAKSARTIHDTYHHIYKGMMERKEMRIKQKRERLKMSAEEIGICIKNAEKLASAMGYGNLEQLNTLTGNPELTLKILLSFYRRMKVLSDFSEGGKAQF